MRCPYCHNRELALGQTKDLESMDYALNFVKNRAPLLGGVVISGGEPLLYKGIPQLVLYIREVMGLKVKVDTNGMFPGPLERLLKEAPPDFIAMDIKTSKEKLPLLGLSTQASESIKKSVKLIQESGLPYQFRTTVHPDMISLKDIDELAQLMKGTENYVLNRFRSGRCLDTEWNSYEDTPLSYLRELKKAFRERGIPCRIPEEDSV